MTTKQLIIIIIMQNIGLYILAIKWLSDVFEKETKHQRIKFLSSVILGFFESWMMAAIFSRYQTIWCLMMIFVFLWFTAGMLTGDERREEFLKNEREKRKRKKYEMVE